MITRLPFVPKQRILNELGVLVPVANDDALRVVVDGKGGKQLGLAAGLDSKMVRQPGIDDLLHHFPQLIDLDREYPPVLIAIAELRDRRLKRLV